MKIVKIRDEYIKLDSLLKFENIVMSGAEAKHIILLGLVKVNGEIETRRGKKIYNNDVVEYNGESFKIKSEI